MKKIKSFIFEKKNTLNKLTFIFFAFLPFSLFLGSAIIISFLIFNSIFISKVPVESLERSLGVIRFLILIMAVSHIIILKKSKYEQLLYKIWFIIFIITTADLIFEYFFGHNILGYKSYMPGRLSGFLNQELKIGNYYYGFILFAISYSIYNFKNKISFALFGIFFFTSIIIGERANFIRIFIMMIIFLFFIEKKLFRKIIYISLFFIILIFTFKDTKVKSRIFDQTIGILGNTKYDLTKSILNTQYGAH